MPRIVDFARSSAQSQVTQLDLWRKLAARKCDHREHPQVVGNGARRSRRFDVACCPALAEYSKFVGLLTLKRPEGRAPKSRQLADAL